MLSRWNRILSFGVRETQQNKSAVSVSPSPSPSISEASQLSLFKGVVRVISESRQQAILGDEELTMFASDSEMQQGPSKNQDGGTAHSVVNHSINGSSRGQDDISVARFNKEFENVI